MGLEDEDPSALTDNKDSVLDKASLDKKNSLQNTILKENTYVQKETSANTLSLPSQNTGQSAGSAGNTDGAGNAGSGGNNAAQQTSEPASHEYTQEEIDALYGIDRDEESSDHDDDDDDDDDDDEEEHEEEHEEPDDDDGGDDDGGDDD